MSSNPNFVNDLVMMAKAYEELPKVQAELDNTTGELTKAYSTIQRLELKLIDRANELDAARQATRKAEVERDHAETMFLETDDKLSAILRVVAGFAPAPVAPVVSTKIETHMGQSEPSPTTQNSGTASTGESLSGVAVSTSVEPTLGESVPTPTPTDPPDTSSAHVAEPALLNPGQSEMDPTEAQPASTIGSTTTPVDTNATEAHEVAQPLPTALADGDGEVGYHNEPTPMWTERWYAWANRMDANYGVGHWPDRPTF